MRLLRVLRQRVRSLVRGAKVDAELARELAFHVEQLTRENIASGMEPAAARLAAQRALGGVAQIEEECRDHRRVHWLTDLLKDFVYAWRTLAKSPGFTSLAVVTLALGVGASIAVYALSEALLLRSLPYPEPERLVRVDNIHQQNPGGFVSHAIFRDWQESSTAFERMALVTMSEVTLAGLGEAERVEGRAVSGAFFELLGVAPQLGRWFTPEEQKPGAACVVMLSHEFWSRKLSSDPEVVGDTIVMDERPCRITGVMPERPCRITGVMPESFHFNESGFVVAQYWTPVSSVSNRRRALMYWAYARLGGGVSLESAQTQMSEIAGRLAQSYPEEADWTVRVRSMRAMLLERFSSELLIFAAAALIVLLVACANVGSLLLARGISRSREIAVRVALGAGRARVVRLLLAESLLLSGMSAALGVVFAAWLLRATIAAAPATLELGEAVSVSAWLAVFAVGLAACTGLLAGLWPALQGSRANLESDLRESGGALVGGKRQMSSLKALVVMEVALSVMLLTFAGLLVKSFTNLLETNLGYRTDRLLTFRAPLPASRYPPGATRRQFWQALQSQVAGVPGVLSVAASDSIPLGGTVSRVLVEVEGQAEPPDLSEPRTRVAVVTPEYFDTMGIPLRLGRNFADRDTAEAERVLIVNEEFVRKLLPDRTPIGARVRFGKGQWSRIVGVIGDGRYWGPRESSDAEAYVPHARVPNVFLHFLSIHTAIPEQAVLSEARRIVQRLDPELVITQVRTMRQSVDLAILPERNMMTLLAGFGVVTLVMATMGLSGVMLYTVSRRRREIGLRIVLGARPADVSCSVLGSAARLVAAGAAIGVLASLASGRILESQLYGVRWYDPAILAAAPALLAVIALAACLLPSRRASVVEPMKVLRQE